MSNSIQTAVETPPKAAELLATEIATFQRELPRLLSAGEQRRWALVHGDEVAGIWDTFADAVEAGYDRFGLDPFLVQQVASEEHAAQHPWQRSGCPS
jgi:hypothetical protein